MSQDLFKAPKAKRPHPKKEPEGWSPPKKKKIKKGFDFLRFCDIVLKYTKYESFKQEDLRKNNMSPLDSGGSGGSTVESFSSESNSSSYTEDGDSRGLELLNRVLPLAGTSPLNKHSHPPRPATREHAQSDDDDDNTITCFCRKPYSGRPMIQCDDCLCWIHYSCAKIRKNKIPDIYVCQHCRDNKAAKRKSGRMLPIYSKSTPPNS